MTTLLPPPQALPKKGNLAENWRQWKQNFDIYLLASQITKEDPTTCALFLHTIGQYGRDIYNDVTILQPLVENTLDELYSMFDNYCNPKTNLTYNRYTFFHSTQAKNEPFDKFLLSLRQQSKNCNFGDLTHSLLITQIISGITNIKLREHLLKTEMDLNQVIEECRATEISEAQAQKMACNQKPQQPPQAAKPKQQVNKDKKEEKPTKNKPENKTNQKIEKGPAPAFLNKCKFCASSHQYGNCPAFGSTCSKCQKPNHFSKVCKN